MRRFALSSSRGTRSLYWGYASGVIATEVPGRGEVVLAERTRPFNESGISSFGQLIAQTEQRLGFRPPYGAWDTAFDAFYVHDYFLYSERQARESQLLVSKRVANRDPGCAQSRRQA